MSLFLYQKVMKNTAWLSCWDTCGPQQCSKESPIGSFHLLWHLKGQALPPGAFTLAFLSKSLEVSTNIKKRKKYKHVWVVRPCLSLFTALCWPTLKAEFSPFFLFYSQVRQENTAPLIGACRILHKNQSTAPMRSSLTPEVSKKLHVLISSCLHLAVFGLTNIVSERNNLNLLSAFQKTSLLVVLAALSLKELKEMYPVGIMIDKLFITENVPGMFRLQGSIKNSNNTILKQHLCWQGQVAKNRNSCWTKWHILISI